VGSSRKRTDGAGTVMARKNGTFTAQISDDGRRHSVGTFTTRAKAERALAAAMVQGPPPAIDTRLGDYLEGWLADRVLIVKLTTLARDRALIRTHVLRHKIARKQVRELRPDDFRAFYRELREHGRADGGPLAPSTVATLDTVLKVALQQLVDERELMHQPSHRQAPSGTWGNRDRNPARDRSGTRWAFGGDLGHARSPGRRHGQR
jgi:hypothetical protein